MIKEWHINLFWLHEHWHITMHSVSNPWKHQKTGRFSDVFSGQRQGALGTNGLTNQNFSISYINKKKIVWLRERLQTVLFLNYYIKEMEKKFTFCILTQNHFLKLTTFCQISLSLNKIPSPRRLFLDRNPIMEIVASKENIFSSNSRQQLLGLSF